MGTGKGGGEVESAVCSGRRERIVGVLHDGVDSTWL